MASTTPAEAASDADGGGVLERIGAQLAALAAQVSEIDERTASMGPGLPRQPVEVALSPESVAQIADALAALQAAGTQALDDAFKSVTDDLTEALSGVVQAEVSRTLAEAGCTVEVAEAAEPDVDVAPHPAPVPPVDPPVAEAQIEEPPPLSLEELDDPFLDALIRKEPLSA